jgi:hypothetical protein
VASFSIQIFNLEVLFSCAYGLLQDCPTFKGIDNSSESTAHMKDHSHNDNK